MTVKCLKHNTWLFSLFFNFFSKNEHFCNSSFIYKLYQKQQWYKQNKKINIKMENINEQWKTFKQSRDRNSLTRFNNWQVSDQGNIRIVYSTGEIRYPKIHECGGHEESGRYKCLSINDFKYVHRIVAQEFCYNPGGSDMTVDHINGNKHDNRATNLRWVTIGDNIRFYKQSKKQQA